MNTGNTKLLLLLSSLLFSTFHGIFAHQKLHTVSSVKKSKKHVMDSQTNNTNAVAYLSLGCFWESQYTYECASLPSVDKLGTEDPPGHCDTSVHTISDKDCVPYSTVVGYMGGEGAFPSYYTNVSQLNYSETLRLIYDPNKLTFEEILKDYWIFGNMDYDPCVPPSMSNYVFRIFATSTEQYTQALASCEQEAIRRNCTLYADVWNASDWVFWKAEEYHQQYNYKQGLVC